MVGGSVTVQSSGVLELMNVVVLPSQVTAEAGAMVTRELTSTGPAIQCSVLADKYTTLNDWWRAANNSATRVLAWQCPERPCTVMHWGTNQCDSANGGTSPTGVGGGHWYRFVGTAGDAIPLMPPGKDHCGTQGAGWLSGWVVGDGPGTGCSGFQQTGPPCDYSTTGRYPIAAEGVVELTACFNNDPGYECASRTMVGVVQCNDFLLWRLPYAPFCNWGYCTAPSGL